MAAPVARETVPAASENTNGAEQSIFGGGIENFFLPFADDAAE